MPKSDGRVGASVRYRPNHDKPGRAGRAARDVGTHSPLASPAPPEWRRRKKQVACVPISCLLSLLGIEPKAPLVEALQFHPDRCIPARNRL